MSDECLDPDGHCAQCERSMEYECCICGHEFSDSGLPPFPAWSTP